MSLSACYLFSGVDRERLQRLRRLAVERPLRPGDWLFREDQAAERIFVLQQGAVELLMRVEDEFELPVKILRDAGDCCGSSSLVPPYRYYLSARVTLSGNALVIPKVSLERQMAQDPALALAIMTNLAGHLLGRLNETRRELKIHFKTLSKSADARF